VTDVDDRLRELFRRRAEDPAPRTSVPPSLPRRARRRIAVNALGAAMVVAVLAAGGAVGIQAIARQSGTVPADHPSPTTTRHRTSPAPSPSPSSGVAACTAGQVRATATLLGAAGSREGVIRLENLSDATCTLQGRPAVTLLDDHLRPIRSGVHFEPAPPGWKVDADPQPEGWPVVTVAPGKAATVRIRWSNWCPQGRATPLWRVRLPGDGSVDVMGIDGETPPPCNGEHLPSTIDVGPFEPERPA
jgi:Protein of unknown function (DUF4232)